MKQVASEAGRIAAAADLFTPARFYAAADGRAGGRGRVAGAMCVCAK